ncbi:hypothetical protein Clacol_004546 [Clathrus columnatus]|uniref:Peptidase S33 tripeptidyl aminopeptidase-like C-terminal domain-containing protein n=1 Tax=Clathrus columnatus TaxID=1419009 RepID=A0AAV5A7T3_9AGAM|nr:hypothetical protein Clacol_004546 [Clathrus columnatus]
MSTTEYALVFPARCDTVASSRGYWGDGRRLVGSSLLWAPSLFMDNPIIRLLERVTHLPHVPVPTTPEEKRPITAYGILIFAMGSVYFLELRLSLFWNTGGKSFVELRLATGSRNELAHRIITVSDLKASESVVIESTSLLRSSESEINPPAFCHRFPTRVVDAVERFIGPFNHTLAFLVLVIGNTADPVTPLENAQKVANLLGKSTRLVKQDY